MIKIGEFGTLHSENDALMNKIVQFTSFIVGPISCLAGIFVALSFILSKNLRYHPSFLIVLISICESASTFYMMLGNISTDENIFNSFLQSLLYYLSFGLNLGAENQSKQAILEQHTKTLCKASNLFMSVFSLGSIMFNTCMCLDLIIILRNPFAPHQKRNKFYIIFVLLISILITVLFIELLTSPCNEDSREEGYFQTRSTYISLST